VTQFSLISLTETNHLGHYRKWDSIWLQYYTDSLTVCSCLFVFCVEQITSDRLPQCCKRSELYNQTLLPSLGLTNEWSFDEVNIPKFRKSRHNLMCMTSCWLLAGPNIEHANIFVRLSHSPRSQGGIIMDMVWSVIWFIIYGTDASKYVDTQLKRYVHIDRRVHGVRKEAEIWKTTESAMFTIRNSKQNMSHIVRWWYFGNLYIRIPYSLEYRTHWRPQQLIYQANGQSKLAWPIKQFTFVNIG